MGSRRPIVWVVVGMGVGAFLVLALSGASLGGLFVLGMLLMCPLLMLGMHAGGGHDRHLDDPSR